MPSTRRQKAKARSSRDTDMSDYDNMDILLGNVNISPFEKESANAIIEPRIIHEQPGK